jgi:hypothetical protein
MQEITIQELEDVTGGARRIARGTSSSTDQMLQLQLAQLANDIKDVSRPQQNNQLAFAAMAAMAMSRFA